MNPIILIALATVLGIGGDCAVKTWCLSSETRLLALGCACWAVQCALWIPIFQATGLARALTLSSAMWIVGSTAIGLFWFQEHLSTPHKLGVGCALAAVALLSVEAS